MEEIPKIDLSLVGSGKYDWILQKYGAVDFKRTVQRNIEKDFIEREAALISVAEQVVPFQAINGLHTIMQATAGGGVKAQFPINNAIGDTGRDTANDPHVFKQVTLDRANVTYHILHEAVMEGGNVGENDSIKEGIEQLGAKMDDHFLGRVKSASFAANDFTAAATWTTTGDIFADVNKAINNIIVNSAINPNTKKAGWFTVIVPIAIREALGKITIVDGVKLTVEELVTQRLGARFLFSRQPFNWDGGAWELSDQALVMPTNDRHVGKFYTFDGGEMPSIFTETSENGKRVSTNSWMKFETAPDEADGTLTKTRRVGTIATVA